MSPNARTIINLLVLSIMLSTHFGCISSKPLVPTANTRSLIIMYDQIPREWPLRNPTNMVIPGIYLPLQQKAFQLDRSQRWARKVLVLHFPATDDSSLVQIMANRYSRKNWLYTDTLLAIKLLPGLQNCYKLDISTYRNKEYGLVPQLKLIPFVCEGNEGELYRDLSLFYDVATQQMSGTDRRIYRKKGYNALFKRQLPTNGPIIKVSDVIDVFD